MAAAWSPILLLLLLWGQSAAARHWALCRPGPLSARHPVLGFWEQIRAGSGCASRGRSASGREVHVLILRGPVGRMGARQVSLELGPAPPGRPPIFVLSSPAPVVWSLQTAQVALGEQWTFQVSPGSRVSALGGVTVTETRLPQTPRGLLRWAREEHGGVSSLAAYRGVNMVYVQLGDGTSGVNPPNLPSPSAFSLPDGVSPGACKLRRNFLSPTHFASGLRPRPLWGCLTSDPPSDPEVHVILSKGARPRPPAHLTVELQAPGGCCSPRRELIVVLKSEASTSWLVQIPHLAGRLRVLASHEVSVSGTEPEPDLAVSSSMSLGLAYASDPMAWAMEQGLPGVTSYTEAEQVNRFLVIVGLDGDAKAPHPSIPLPRPAKISPMVWERSRAAPGGGRTVRLAGALSVACLSERVAVYVNKDMLQFSCSSPALSETSRSAEPIPDLPLHLGRVLLSLEVYSSEAFAKAQGPCTVSANSRVFVEAALAAFDPRLSFSIRLCFLSPSSSSSLDSPYTLVRGGCPAHPDVSLHPPHKGAAGPALSPGSQELQRLSFLLRPLYNDSIQFLHCRLALCTQEPQGQAGAYGGALPKCGPQACPSSRVGEPGSGRFQHTFTKPIIVTVGRLARATKPTPGTDPFLVPFPLAGRRGKMLKEAPRPEQGETPPAPLPQGLELPTVVGIVFSAFIIGVSLTGGLWLIHSRTAHRGLPVRVLGNTLAAAPLSPPAGARPCGSRDQQPIGLCSAQPGRPLGEGPLHLARRAPSL
ncbi:dual specificity mitogen-activated protein kinase kinase 7 isoform X8 [Mauremys reevesii]|uniref:dual specificity mitogen-activated protein kinase kinase 7 isoform X8 n=1 Tax=Mauremys reevesii TaxID=260615 RepID=UPI0019401EF4|nr:dual specificity mitogen-activated protein kinase kinase 7 isoform X8 [Mauremys reevesii]